MTINPLKFCHKCSRSKSIDLFSKQASSPDGLQSKCKDCFREYYLSNKQAYSVRKKKYRKTESCKISNKKYRDKNRKKIREKWNKSYAEGKYRRDKGYIAAISAKRRAAKRRATPPWLTREDIKAIEEIYLEAARLTEETGIPHHVDHIVPLQGKNVCGLHVPNNLQILTESENCRKSNHFYED